MIKFKYLNLKNITRSKFIENSKTNLSKHSSQFKLLKKPSNVKPYIDDVCNLADSNKKALGFLPESVFHVQADRERLWLVIESEKNTLAGFLLFGGRYPNLKITQLFVCEEYRRQGVAKLLISSIKEYAKENLWSTLSARVAQDLPSNSFWSKQGLKIIRSESGGKSTGRKINIRLWEVPEASLFWKPPASNEELIFSHSPQLDNAIFVLDLNVFFDVIKGRVHQNEAQWVISCAMAGRVKLAVTPEFSAELDRNTSQNNSDPVLKFAKALPCLSELPGKSVESKVDEIRTIVFRGQLKTGRRAANDASDLVHLAYCILHGATGFISRDLRLLEASDALRKKYELEILSPADLIDPKFSSVSAERVKSDSNEVVISRLDQKMEDAAKLFLNRMLPNLDTTNIFAKGMSHDPRELLIAKLSDSIVGTLAVRRGAVASKIIYAFLAVDEMSRVENLAYDQLLEHLRNQLKLNEIQSIQIQVPVDSVGLIETLRRRGYRRIDKHFSDGTVLYGKIAYSGLITKKTWSNFVYDFKKISDLAVEFDQDSTQPSKPPFKIVATGGAKQEMSLFDFETLISPGVLAFPSRQGTIVPIRREYTRILMPEVVPQAELFAASAASVRIERVYFLKKDRTTLFPRSSIVVFYESSYGEGHGEAVGYGRVTYSGYLTVSEAINKLSRQGALSKGRLEKMADSNHRLTAFTFDSFQVFQKPIPMAVLKQNELISGANLVTAEKLKQTSLLWILEYGLKK